MLSNLSQSSTSSINLQHSEKLNTNIKIQSKNSSQTTSSFKIIFSAVKNNKILSFIGIFATINIISLLKPLHLRRPEILARNRLEHRPN